MFLIFSKTTQNYRIKLIDVTVALQNELVLGIDIKRFPATGIRSLKPNGAISLSLLPDHP